MVDDRIFRLYPQFHPKQDSRSGNTMAIHPVFDSGLLCSRHVCCWLFWLVIVSFDDTMHLLLFEKQGHLGWQLCIVRAIELGDCNCRRTRLARS